MKWGHHNSPVALPDINYQDQGLTNSEATKSEDKINSLVRQKTPLSFLIAMASHFYNIKITGCASYLFLKYFFIYSSTVTHMNMMCFDHLILLSYRPPILSGMVHFNSEITTLANLLSVSLA